MAPKNKASKLFLAIAAIAILRTDVVEYQYQVVEAATEKAVTALVIIDVQNCFTGNGTLAVRNGDDVVPVINGLRAEHHFDVVVLSQDWHCRDHVSFASCYVGLEPFDEINLTYTLPTG